MAGAAGIVALGFVGSRFLGLLRQVAIADAFGTDPDLAAYWVAFRLPDLVFQLLAGATLSAAFIPTFSRVQLRLGEQQAWRLASSVLNLIALATVVLAGVAFVLAPWVVPWLAPGLGVESGREDELTALAVELTRWMLLSPIFFGVSGMATGILNARQHFAAPALAPMIYNLSIVLGALFLSEPYGVHGLAIAVVAGAAGHLLVQLPALYAVGMRWRPTFDVASEGVREVARLMGPRVIGLAAAQINFIVVIFFASFVSDAAISAVNYAFLMAMLPVGVVGMAISTAIFPTLARQGAAQQLQALRASVGSSLRMILFLAIPAAVGLMALAEPAVRLLLERGAFDASDTSLVAGVLLFYGLGIPAVAAIEIISRGFYALSDTRTPVQVAVLAMLLNIVLCLAFVAPLGARGLALAGSLAALVECAALWWLLHERLGDLEPRQMRASLLRTLAASAVMGEVILLLRLLLDYAGLDGGSVFGALALAVVAGGGGVLAFIATASIVGSQEYRMLAGRLRA